MGGGGGEVATTDVTSIASSCNCYLIVYNLILHGKRVIDLSANNERSGIIQKGV